MDENNQCIESQESNVCTVPADSTSLRREANACTVEEQRTVMSSEQQRMSQAADPYLPDLCFDEHEPDSCEEPAVLTGEVCEEPAVPTGEVCEEPAPPTGEVCEEDAFYLDFGIDEDGMCVDPDQAVCEEEQSAASPEESRPETELECTPPTSVTEFVDLSEDNFDRIDTNGDGFMSEDEIDAAVQNPEFTGRDARFVAALKEHQEELEELNDDELGDENDGISRADIAQFDALRQQEEQERTDWAYARQYASENFSTLDADSDGHVTEGELDSAIQRGGLSEEQIHHLETLKRLSSDIEECHNDEIGDENDGFTQADLDSYYQQHHVPQDHVQLVWGVQGTMDEAQRRAEEASSRDLYANADDPLSDIVPEAVQQGGVGDCYFNSALASLAAQNPQAIRDMIHDNGNGTYTVTFPGAPDEPITVTAPTEQELALYSHGSEHGLWAPIMAKAYGQYCQESVFRRSPFNLGGGDVPEEGSDGGSLRNAGLRILTGRDVNSDSTTFTTEEGLHEALSSAFRDGRPVTCYINNLPGDRTSIGLPDGHEYSVTGYDPETRTVTIRNPWGHDEPKNADGTPRDGVDDGVFTMSIEEFNREFSGLAYAE